MTDSKTAGSGGKFPLAGKKVFCGFAGINPVRWGSGTRENSLSDEREKVRRFESTVLCHLDAAYNLARWLAHDANDAEDIVQESCLRAFRSIDSVRSADARCWLLSIVRNTSYTWLKKYRQRGPKFIADDLMDEIPGNQANDPAAELLRQADRAMLNETMEQLPVEYREVLVLREFEGMSYQQIAEIAQVPIGTVMSRLARARQRLAASLAKRMQQEV
jgi:RNA polymerase sigma-70 factor (ECF subfamily)